MPLDVRKVSINVAVTFFFSISIFTIIRGMSPFTCCKRAIMGAVIVYIVAGVAAKLINLILIDAMVTGQVEHKENSETRKKAHERETK